MTNKDIRSRGKWMTAQNRIGSIGASLLLMLFQSFYVYVILFLFSPVITVLRFSAAGRTPGIFLSLLLATSLPALLLFLIDIVLFIPLGIGAVRFFVLQVQGPVRLRDQLGYGYRNFSVVIKTILLARLKTTLMFCLFIIPGIIQSYRYFAVPYLLANRTELDENILQRSETIMKGWKGRTFAMGLFFGLMSLGFSLLVFVAGTLLSVVIPPLGVARIAGIPAVSVLIMIASSLISLFHILPYANNSHAFLENEIWEEGMRKRMEKKVDLLLLIPLILAILMAVVLFLTSAGNRTVDLNEAIENGEAFEDSRRAALSVRWPLGRIATGADDGRGYYAVLLEDLSVMLVSTEKTATRDAMELLIKDMENTGIRGSAAPLTVEGKLHPLEEDELIEIFEEFLDYIMVDSMRETYARYWVLDE